MKLIHTGPYERNVPNVGLVPAHEIFEVPDHRGKSLLLHNPVLYQKIPDHLLAQLEAKDARIAELEAQLGIGKSKGGRPRKVEVAV